MSFFTNSSVIIVNGGNFTRINSQTKDAGRSIPSLAIDDAKYSHNRWAYGSVSMGDHRQAFIMILFVLLS
jgi:hypothetical protein